MVATLEKEIGAGLFTRSTRALALTEAGAEYLQRVEAALAALDEADYAARGTGELRGVLRVGASSSFTEHMVIPRLDEFLARNPKLRVVLLEPISKPQNWRRRMQMAASWTKPRKLMG
jgi:DNA-binding transcriptional LysR family regulator